MDGKDLTIVGITVRPDRVDWAKQHFNCPVVTDINELFESTNPDVIAVLNENNLKSEAIIASLKGGFDVVVDKPLAVKLSEQQDIEDQLIKSPEKRLLHLLTLRGASQWTGLREVVRSGKIGIPAFTHIRMAVQLKRNERPPWFLDYRKSGGMFLDLLIHALDQVEWITGGRIKAITAHTGNLGLEGDTHIRNHAAAFCELDDGSSALVEGQRMLPGTKRSDYRAAVAGTDGYAEFVIGEEKLKVTSPDAADLSVELLPDPISIVQDWLEGGNLVDQEASLRANHLSILATMSAANHKRIEVPDTIGVD